MAWWKAIWAPGKPAGAGTSLEPKPEETSKDVKDRRKGLRVRTRPWVWAEYEGKEFRLENLSITGAFIRTKTPPAVGTEVQLRLVGERLLEPIALTGLVRHSRPGFGMGVEFKQPYERADVWLREVLSNLSSCRILIVDDDPNIRRVLTVTFTNENYDVLTATDGQEGLERALDSQPDLIILDMDISDVSGLEVCQRMRAHPNLVHVPIVILSATTDLAEIGMAQRSGAAMFVAKPFDSGRLLNCVRMLLKQ